MKKLNHHNLVSLIEVLDDPNEDSLYMVLEMCKKGVVMKVGMNERADPYDPESCRCWFRDLILGIEYLHAQGIVHRDIKPDNLLLTEDDVLKVVDFGVSEMFEKESDMKTAKSAGSPAFLPPELCVSRHGGISGKAADIWSMGVTLYCLYFGKVPFEKLGVLDLYESIKNDELHLEGDCEEDFKDLIFKILEKDPSKRIQMPELRVSMICNLSQHIVRLTANKEHSWVTKRGVDPLLSAEENTVELIELPTEEEMNRAITSNLSDLIVVVCGTILYFVYSRILNISQMKAVKKFKCLLNRRRPYLMSSILGQGTRMVQPPLSIDNDNSTATRDRAHSMDTHDRRPLEGALVQEGVHRKIDPDLMGKSPPDREDGAVVQSPTTLRSGSYDQQGGGRSTPSKRKLGARPEAHRSEGGTRPLDIGHGKDSGRGHAHDPLEDYLFLDVGPDGDGGPHSPPAVSESPPATEVDIYETAYHEEIERIRAEQGRQATLYLTRRVDSMSEYQQDENMVGLDKAHTQPQSRFAELLQKVKDKHEAAEGSSERDGNNVAPTR